jgi:hypothetical protein
MTYRQQFLFRRPVKRKAKPKTMASPTRGNYDRATLASFLAPEQLPPMEPPAIVPSRRAIA